MNTVSPAPVQTKYDQGVAASTQPGTSGFSGYFNRDWLNWWQQLATAANGLIGLQSSGTQSKLPMNLTPASAGQLYFVTDYAHQLQWSGKAWGWAPGELGSGFIVAFPDAPQGNKWHPCDGSTVNKLNQDGTVSSVVLPSTAGSYYRQ